MRTPWRVLPGLLLIAAAHCLPYTDLTNQHPLPSQEQQVPGFEPQEAGSFDYPGFFAGSLPVPNEAVLTIGCQGPDRLCVKKHLCHNGFVNPYHVGFTGLNGGVQECDVSEEICCTLAKYEPIEETGSQFGGVLEVGQKEQGVEQEQEEAELEGGAGGTSFETVQQTAAVDKTDHNQIPAEGGESAAGFVTFAPPVQVGCAAALLCVDERFCTLSGIVSTEPVQLTSKQLLRRVPLSACKNPENGAIGRCCRDPNYVDPWPTGNLPANYSGGFDEQGFPTFLNIKRVEPPKTPPELQPRPKVPVNVEEPKAESVASPAPTVTGDTNVIPHFLLPPNEVAMNVNNLQDSVKGVIHEQGEDSHPGAVELKCGVKNNVARQPDVEDSVTTFGEIPWQAMVLHAAERKILCSGAIIGANMVLTAANCVDNFAPNELSIKLGEWKLGYELKHEEPLPFEILNVNSIDVHPQYRSGYAGHDLALLSLEHQATYGYHVSPLCLPEVEHIPQESRNCLATGWGKQILQSHYAGAVMHAIKVDVLSNENCANRLLSTQFATNVADSAICAKTMKDVNNVCEADIGGPLACDDGSGVYELVGVYSQDNGCQVENQVAMFAPVDMQWVKTIMSGLQRPVDQPAVEMETPEFEIGDTTDYRRSNYTANNQYLPPQ